MRKYYNDFNEEYERGYEDGRREALRESMADFLSREEIERSILKISRKYGLNADFNSTGDLYGTINSKSGIFRLKFDEVPVIELIHKFKDMDFYPFKIEIKGSFSSLYDMKNLKHFEDVVNDVVNDLKNLLACWKDLDSMNLNYKKPKK